ncbi:MAG: sugar phosphate isomerase/epimerase, partial [Armatimonadetes bacterium]|nr:sugar phosphate isomerase/epimerase [Armatimonadota bacterium]
MNDNIGISTWSLLHLPPFEAVKQIKLLGFKNIELWGDYPHFWPEYFLGKNKLKILIELLKSFNNISLHAPCVNLGDKNPGLRREALNQVKKSLEFASKLGCQNITLHPGYIFKRMQGWFFYEEACQYTLEALKEITALSKEKDILIGIENVKGQLGFKISEMKDLVKKINSKKLKITFDLAHAHLNKEEKIETFFKEFKKDIIEIHISDNLGDEDTHLPLFQGNINFKKVFEIFYKNNYSGKFIGELLWIPESPLKPI